LISYGAACARARFGTVVGIAECARLLLEARRDRSRRRSLAHLQAPRIVLESPRQGRALASECVDAGSCRARERNARARAAPCDRSAVSGNASKRPCRCRPTDGIAHLALPPNDMLWRVPARHCSETPDHILRLRLVSAPGRSHGRGGARRRRRNEAQIAASC